MRLKSMAKYTIKIPIQKKGRNVVSSRVLMSVFIWSCDYFKSRRKGKVKTKIDSNNQSTKTTAVAATTMKKTRERKKNMVEN